MRISETLIFSDNLDRTVEFLLGTGLTLKIREDWGWALFEDPHSKQRVGVLLKEAWEEDESGFTPRVSFESDDLDSDRALLMAHGAAVSDITGDEDSTRACTFVDPDGNAFFLWQSHE